MPPHYTIDPYYDSPDWRDLRAKVLKRDKYICRYCHGNAHQADHVIPRRQGGRDSLKNLVACCSPCNRTAGNLRFKSIKDKQDYILINRVNHLTDPRPLVHHNETKTPTLLITTHGTLYTKLSEKRRAEKQS